MTVDETGRMLEYEARNRQRGIARNAEQPIVLKKGSWLREPLSQAEFVEHIEGLAALLDTDGTAPRIQYSCILPNGETKSMHDALEPANILTLDLHYNLSALVQGTHSELHAHSLPRRPKHPLAKWMQNALLIGEALGALGIGYILAKTGAEQKSVYVAGAGLLVVASGIIDVTRRIIAEYTHGMELFFHSTLPRPTADDGMRYYQTQNKLREYCQKHS